MNMLKQIMNWYSKYCNGDWEHDSRIKIETLDNPGWSISINVEGTEQEDKKFETLDLERTDIDWLYCKVENNLYTGSGGANNLEELLKVFIDWAESHE